MTSTSSPNDRNQSFEIGEGLEGGLEPSDKETKDHRLQLFLKDIVAEGDVNRQQFEEEAAGHKIRCVYACVCV
jgi:hypothetical protein